MEKLKTPCLILDLERVRKNAERMSRIASGRQVRLRPHIKTHKCIEVAKIQTAQHDGPVTVSTLAEVRAFAGHGFADFTYAVPIERGKFAEVFAIIRSDIRLNLLTDDLETAQELNQAARHAGLRISVFLKVDCGYHRVGIEPQTSAAVEIPQFISDSSNLEFAGILTHAGHSYNVQTAAEVKEIARQERDIMVAFAEKLRAKDIEVPCVSIGSTPTVSLADHLDGIDEIRPGNYIFFDAFQANLGSCSFDDCALTVLAAVTHRDNQRRKIVVDAGAIALSKDRGAFHIDPCSGYGRVWDLDGRDLQLRIESLSQEHGIFTVEDEVTFKRLKVGSRVRILANHSCLSAAQHSHYHILENGKIIDRWEIHRGW